jgi:hypothetical protein
VPYVTSFFYVESCIKSSKQVRVTEKYTFNKKRSEESSSNVCSADLEDSLGKEELYLRKVIIYDA